MKQENETNIIVTIKELIRLNIKDKSYRIKDLIQEDFSKEKSN